MDPTPDRVTLGRTGLRVRPAGLGCGGPSRLGRTRGASERESLALVERALDLGVDFIDTAAAYGTEGIVGRAIAGRRDRVVLSTKALPEGRDGLIRAHELRRLLDRSLERLGSDYVDVYHLHGVLLDHYDYALAELVPELEKAREAGKIRFLGITERFVADPQHRMLARALEDDCWDVVMVGFNLLNPSARERVLAPARARDTGVLVMFAVRRALSRPEVLRDVVAGLVAGGALPQGDLDPSDPLGFLVGEGGAESVVDAAYRFCRHEPGVHVVLSGTGHAAHLEANLRSLARGPLPPRCLARLREAFGAIDWLSGN